MLKKYSQDTIVAIATPIGAGAIGIIRISGPRAKNILDKIFSKKNLKPRKLTLGWVLDKQKKIDQVMAVIMPSPHSYTGEDVVEIQSHSSSIILNEILDLILNNGARLAEPGEFTKRAFLNGKIDLAQAEAIGDLTLAKSASFARLAADQLSGKLSQQINKIRQKIVEIVAHQTALLDFSEEDIDVQDMAQMEKSIIEQINSIDRLLKNAQQAAHLKEGYKVAIIGLPNAGKSTLLNTLLGYDRAIVTSVAGTTRDVLQEGININGIYIRLSDTAGLNKDPDKVEKIGISRSRREIKNSDLILLTIEPKMLDKTVDYLNKTKISQIINPKNTLIVATKSDNTKSHKIEYQNFRSVGISAKKNLGIDTLKRLIYQRALGQIELENSLITTKRQIKILSSVNKSLRSVHKLIKDRASQDLLLAEMREAIVLLNQLTGEDTNEQIIEEMFKNFCIGK